MKHDFEEPIYHSFLGRRGDPSYSVVWRGARLQRAGDGPAWPEPRRSLQLLLEEIHHEDSAHVG